MILDFSFAQESLILDLLLNLSKIWFDEFLFRELLAVQCCLLLFSFKVEKCMFCLLLLLFEVFFPLPLNISATLVTFFSFSSSEDLQGKNSGQRLIV